MDDIKVFLLPIAGALLSAATIGMFSFADSSDQNQTEPEREDKFGGHKNLRIFYWVFLTLCNVGMGISLALHQVAWPPALKALYIVSILWPCAWSDFQTMRIPNKCLLVGLGYRAILFIFELVTVQPGLLAVLASEAIAALALLLSSFLCRIIIRNSVGGGDIKLMALMGLFLGLNGIWNAVLMSFLIIFVVAVGLLVFKKKKKNDAIPFAPALLAGTVLTVLFAAI